jgi:hypothetical protein
MASSGWRPGAIYLCGGDLTSGPRDACPDPLHDFPLPAGYTDASEAADSRLRHRWTQRRCPACGLYGWRPGDPTGDPCDERVPAAGALLGEDSTDADQ